MSFTYLYYKQIIVRKSCAKCHFTNTQRPSDITIGDFWGWEKVDPNLFDKDNKGISLMLINTEKGAKLFEAIQNNINTIPVELKSCLQYNLCHPSKQDSRRDKFEKEYARKGFRYVYLKYGEEGWRHKLSALSIKIKNKLLRLLKLSYL